MGTESAKSVILLGKGDLAIRVAEWFLAAPNYELQMIVPVVPEPAWAGSLSGWASKHRIPIVESGHFRDIPDVDRDDWSLDLGFSVFYDKIIKGWFIGKCAMLLNLHNSPLPEYRGVSPINWALKNEEEEHGVTIHQITPGIDDGPIMAQVRYSIYPEFDEVVDVYQRGLAYGWTLFEQTMPILDSIKPRPQNEADATYYSLEDNEKLGERRNFTRATSLNLSARSSA